MDGWIKIHRQIKDHWIWENSQYFKAWIGILLNVNHEDRKVLIEGELIECKRGQSILSLGGWVKYLGKKWTIQRVRTFFELLKHDGMITAEGMRKTTRVTVCNYDDYQDQQQAKNKQRTSKEQADNNKQECKECKEEEYIYSKFYDSQIETATNENYKALVHYLFGKNKLEKKLTGVLSIRDQLTEKQFIEVMVKCEASKKKLGDILTKIENDKKYYKGKQSLYLTLLNWAEDKFIK